MWYCAIGLMCYIEIMVLQSYNLIDAKNNKAGSRIVEPILTIIKETIDNIGLLPYMKVVKDSWGINFISSLGSCLSGILSLYLKSTASLIVQL